ncbi:MAG: hypothetical protein V1645_02270 [archaeon]
MVSFSGKEVGHLVFATLALGVVFGFDDGRESFIVSLWFLNFFRVCLISAAVLLAYSLAQKLVANHYGCSSEFRLWSVQRYWFKPINKFKRPMPLGVIVGLLVAFLSSGKLFFAGVASFDLIEERYRRVGRKYLNVTAIEVAKIALSGVFASLLLAYIMAGFGFKDFVFVATLFSVFQMIPLPHLDGVRIFFGSIPIFAFSAAFVLLSALLLNLVSASTAFFFSFIAAGIFFIMFFYYRTYSS